MFSFLWPFGRQARKRMIFEYSDGKHKRRIDPLVALRGFKEHPEYREDLHPQLVEEGDEEAGRITAQAVCDVFDVQEFDPETGEGLTELERVELLGQFTDWVWMQKKSLDDSQTEQQPTDATLSDSENETTTPTLDSSSTLTEPSSEKPTGHS